ncbi:hypothetical protein ACRAWF_27825 [Streptomyces sp. L7]
MGGRDYTPTNTTLGGTVPQSKLSDALAAAQKALKDAVTAIQAAWTDWASDGQHDPHYHVKKILDGISQWVINNNIDHVLEETYVTEGGGGTTYSHRRQLQAGTSPSTATSPSTPPGRRSPTPPSKSWSDHADAKLKQPSIDALSAVKNAWADVEDAFAQEVKNKNSETLLEVLQKEENEIAEDKANEANDKLNDNLNNLGDNLNNLGDNLNNLNDNVNDNPQQPGGQPQQPQRRPERQPQQSRRRPRQPRHEPQHQPERQPQQHR